MTPAEECATATKSSLCERFRTEYKERCVQDHIGTRMFELDSGRSIILRFAMLQGRIGKRQSFHLAVLVDCKTENVCIDVIVFPENAHGVGDHYHGFIRNSDELGIFAEGNGRVEGMALNDLSFIPTRSGFGKHILGGWESAEIASTLVRLCQNPNENISEDPDEYFHRLRDVLRKNYKDDDFVLDFYGNMRRILNN